MTWYVLRRHWVKPGEPEPVKVEDKGWFTDRQEAERVKASMEARAPTHFRYVIEARAPTHFRYVIEAIP